jgi:hypothetical protein
MLLPGVEDDFMPISLSSSKNEEEHKAKFKKDKSSFF